MPKFLQGNYELPNKPSQFVEFGDAHKTLTDEFEESALAKLGGSICFVMKNATLLWEGDDSEESG